MSSLINRRRQLNLTATALLAQTFLSCSFGRTLPALVLTLGIGMAATNAQAANFNVANETQLAAAVAAAANGDTITFTADIELSAKGKAGTIKTNVTINGGGHKLLGKAGANANGLYVQSGTVTIQNLDLSNLTTKGTTGGSGIGGGGGGAGTGAGLFVGAAANVTLSNVILKNNSAVGGNGGGGVSDSGSNVVQGGGGGGSGPNAANGQAGGTGVAGPGGPVGGGDGNGGNGQWGAGGGGGGTRGSAKGGNGGFGGGGGGSMDEGVGTGGILGGNGGAGTSSRNGDKVYAGGGGGGAGMGGAIFVQDGGKLSVTGTLTIVDNTVAGGTGGGSTSPSGAGGNGRGAGAGLFLAGNGTLNLSSAAGETQTISDVITDQTGAGGTGANAGSWALAKAGAGTLTLTGANSYTGGTTVSGGVLRGNATSLKGAIVNNASVVFDQTADGTYAGIMSGSGALTVTGAKLTLTGVNTYTGTTSVTGNGTLELTAANSIAAAAGAFALDNGSLLIAGTSAFNHAITVTNRGSLGSSSGIVTLGGVISGAGALEINAGTVSLAANNTFSGGLNVSGGATAFFTADASLGAAGAVNLSNGGMIGVAANAAANIVTNRNLTLSGGGGISGAQHAVNWSGAISGAGGLVVSGANVVELSGTNTYSGGTQIKGGKLKIDSDARLGAVGGGLEFSNSGSLLAAQSFNTARAINVGTGGGGFELGAGTTLGLSGAITGGVVNLTGQGTLVVTGANANQGFAIYGGTLQGEAASLGRGIQFDVSPSNTNSRQVVFAQATDGTFTGDIGGTDTRQGTGKVIKTGTGKLTLTGESSFRAQSGAAFEVQAGTLQGNSKNLTGSILNNGALIFDQTFDGSYYGAITGTGSVTVSGAGKLALNAASTIAGPVSVTGGATLVVSNASNFGGSSTLGLNGGTLMLANGSPAFNKAITITGTGGLASTGGTTPNNGVATMSGVISGAGQLDVNSNTVILAANNTFTGGLRVIGANAQALFTTDANLGTAGQAITLQNGGIVGTTADAAPNITMTRNLNLVGSGGLSAALHPLVYNGTISGSGAFIKSGGGIVNLIGTNNATGGTAVRAGTLQVTSDDKLGAAGAKLELSENGHLWATQSFTTARAVSLGGVPGGGFQLDSGTTLTLTGPISGTILSLLGTGTLVLNGTSTYAGITNSGGTIRGNTNTLKGNIVFDYNVNNTNARSVVFDEATKGTSTFAGNITGLGTETGYGTIVKTGVGSLILTGESRFTGLAATDYAFDVQQGLLEGSTKNLVGKIHIAKGAELAFNQIVEGTYAGGLSGEGSLTKNNVGKLILAGINTANGGTDINRGLLALTGTLTSGGTGTEINSGGTLSVNGTLNSNVVVNTGGTLEGSSRVNGNVKNNGGKINPGNSIGHLTINGDFEFDDGEMVVEVNAAGESDRIIVVGAGHTATIYAGTLTVVQEPGVYTPGTVYTIVTAEGGGTAHFDEITDATTAFVSPQLSFDAQNLYLTIGFAPGAFRAGGETANQQAVGSALDLAATGSNSALLTALAAVPVGSGSAALQQLSGQPYADFATVNLRASQLFMNAVGRQNASDRGSALGGQQSVALDAPGLDGQSRFIGWVSGIGTTGGLDGNANASELSYSLGGTAFGINYRIDPSYQIGIAGAYTGGSQSVDGFMGDSSTDALSVALNGSYQQGSFYVDALLGYTNASNELQRIMAVPGVSGIAYGDTDANQFLGQIEAGYRFAFEGSAHASITPFGRLQLVNSRQDAFIETGGSAFNLMVNEQTTTSVRTTLGADFATRFDLGNGMPLDLSLRLGWVHEFGDIDRPLTAAFTAAPWAPFTVYGAPEQRDSALIGLAAELKILDNTSLFASYDAELGSGSDTHQLWGGVRFTW